jgi:hypothetical protein
MEAMDPGDRFKTIREAAIDFGKFYNAKSIQKGQEYGSVIYKVVENDQTYYSYTVAKGGGNDGVTTSKSPDGTTSVADIHSHGKYEKGYFNNDFSIKDKADNDKTGLVGYVTTPDGSLKKYDPSTSAVNTLSTDLPSDKNDPQRKNDISIYTGNSEKKDHQNLVNTLTPINERILTKQDNTQVNPRILIPIKKK